MVPCTLFYKADALAVGGYRQDVMPNEAGTRYEDFSEDLDLWCRMSDLGYRGRYFLTLRESLLRYRKPLESLSTSNLGLMQLKMRVGQGLRRRSVEGRTKSGGLHGIPWDRWTLCGLALRQGGRVLQARGLAYAKSSYSDWHFICSNCLMSPKRCVKDSDPKGGTMKDGLSNSQARFEAQVLKALFEGFAEYKVRHAVLRNYERLPHSVGARDIDIVVHPNDLRAACVLVAGIARTNGLSLANHFADERLSQFALVRRDADGGLQQIKIDFFIRSEVYGIEVLSTTDMLANLRHHNGVPVVADYVLLLDKWLFHLLVGRPLHAKYDADFAAIACEGAVLTAILSRGLREPRAAELVAAMAAGKGSAQVLSESERRFALARLWASRALRPAAKPSLRGLPLARLAAPTRRIPFGQWPGRIGQDHGNRDGRDPTARHLRRQRRALRAFPAHDAAAHCRGGEKGPRRRDGGRRL